jgi:hypothetical protein
MHPIEKRIQGISQESDRSDRLCDHAQPVIP